MRGRLLQVRWGEMTVVRLEIWLKYCVRLHTGSQQCLNLWDTSQQVVLYMESTTPQDAHLGVPIKLQGLTLSYDHHLCHPRNGKGFGEEGAEHSRLNLGYKGDINRDEWRVCLPASLQKWNLLYSPCHCSPECTDSCTFQDSLTHSL